MELLGIIERNLNTMIEITRLLKKLSLLKMANQAMVRFLRKENINTTRKIILFQKQNIIQRKERMFLLIKSNMNTMKAIIKS